jgi:lysophospholipase L1-like esterase
MSKKKFYIFFSILLALSFGIKAYASLTLGATTISSDGTLTLTGGGTLTLPTTPGTAGQFLQTDGTGVTSWVTLGGTGGALEITANKSLNILTDGTSDTKYPSVKAVKDYTDSKILGLLNYRGGYDASSNLYPTTGGSGTGGAVLKGDTYVISTQGSLGGNQIQVGDSIIANFDNPGQDTIKWNTLNTNISYVPENQANKVLSINSSSTDTQYPSAKLLFDQLALKQPLGSGVSQWINGANGLISYNNGNVMVGITVLSPTTGITAPGAVGTPTYQWAGWGDSLTAGNEDGTGVTYPLELQRLTGRSVFNGGGGGDTSTQIATRMIAATDKYGYCSIIWAGRNNYGSQATVLSDVASMVAALTTSPKCFVVLSVLNGNFANEFIGQSNYIQIANLNAALAAAYPGNYLDVRTPLVAAFQSGIPQDVTDHANDIPPSSLRFDNIHMNAAGYRLVAATVAPFINAHFPGHDITLNDLQSLFGLTPSFSNGIGFGFSSILKLSGDQSSLQTDRNLIPAIDGVGNLGFAPTQQRWQSLFLSNSINVNNGKFVVGNNGIVSGAHFKTSTGGTPTFAAQAGAGTGATVSLTGSDQYHLVTVTTGGSGAAIGILFQVSYAISFVGTPVCMAGPANAAAVALPVYRSAGNNGFANWSTTSAPATGTVYMYAVHCGE